MSATREQLLAMVLAAPGGIEAMLRQYDTAEMVEMLRCTPGFLERNIRTLPHQKLGDKVRFDFVDYLLLKELCRVDPDAPRLEQAPADDAATPITGARSYKQLTPAGGRKR